MSYKYCLVRKIVALFGMIRSWFYSNIKNNKFISGFSMGDLQAYARVKRNKTYILKPDTGCQGRGIYLTKSVKDLKPQEKMICQVYIAKPFLIDGYKCDFRIYTLITSCDPLRIFVYNDGLVR